MLPDGDEQPVEISEAALTVIDPETFVWTEGLSEWMPASSFQASSQHAQSLPAATEPSNPWWAATDADNQPVADVAGIAEADWLDAVEAAILTPPVPDGAPPTTEPLSAAEPPCEPAAPSPPVADTSTDSSPAAEEATSASPVPASSSTGFGQLLLELIETERSYMVCLPRAHRTAAARSP